jgi:exodeoxyribonuclease V alpha subunit
VANDQNGLVDGLFSVDRITYANPETGWAVLHVLPADKPASAGLVAVGDFESPEEGACYHIRGRWTVDAKHGAQVRVESAVPEMPQSLPAIERYLGGATIKGLGPHYAKALVNHFGTGTLEELQAGGKHLERVPGIGPKRAQAIRESWAEHQGTHQLMVNLQGTAQLTPRQAQRIYRQYGSDAWDVVRQNPYRLAEDLRGYGFRTCDRIARQLGLAPDAPERIRAAIIHVVKQALSEGHLWTDPDGLDAATNELLGLPVAVIAPERAALVAEGRLADGSLGEDPEPKLYLPPVLEAESRAANHLAWLLRTPVLGLSPDRAELLVQRQSESALTQEQAQAVQRVLEGTRLLILTGGPGSGKTTTVRSLIRCLETIGRSYALCATTGRASKQLAISAQRNASTLHRHLGIGTRGSHLAKASEEVLIVDESSMIDYWLIDQMLARIGSHTQLLLVGDVDQLPPVGPGAVLQDLIEATDDGLPGAAVVRLTKLFRQTAGAESLIAANCKRVRQGIRPVRPVGTESDYFEMPADSPEGARELAVSLASRRLPSYLGVQPDDVQVLAPMHGGDAGVQAINRALQEVLNPPTRGKDELPLPGRRASANAPSELRVGDKVRQTRNDYRKEVLNGDIGRVVSMDVASRTVTVDFDGRRVSYTWDDLDDLVHAWAMTVHSAQGSQWPAVVVIMLTSHFVMLERNILYTALSRAQRLAVLISQEKAIRIAVARDRSLRRRTALAARLDHAIESGA